MLKKFFRNRHQSFLQALSQNKQKKEADEKAALEAKQKQKDKIKQMVIGDGSHIKAKVFEPAANVQADGEQVNVQQQLDQTQVSLIQTSNTVKSHKSKPNLLKRGNSSSALTNLEKAYNADV